MRPSGSSRRRVVIVGAVLLAACDGNGADGDADVGVASTAAPATTGTTDTSETTDTADATDTTAVAGPTRPRHVPSITVPLLDSSPRDDSVPSALQAALGSSVDGLPAPAVPLEELFAGGPPPDGIPSIDLPRFHPVDDIDYLADNEPVLALEIEGEHRAYPVQIMIWHEIVNDTLGGVPVAVTYCPLCNSAVAYDRRVDGRILQFGTSGLLWNSALVMYDRQTESLWSHFNGEAIAGVLTGVELDVFPVSTVPWGMWRAAHPDALVLSRHTGAERPYGQNPYPGYDDVNSAPLLFEGEVDGRFTAMTRVVGVEADGAAAAIPLTVLRERRVVELELGGAELVALWEPGTASALDAAEIATGVDVGASGVFAPVVEGRRLTLVAADDGFTDAETGSRWNVLGEAVGGPLAGKRLSSYPHVDTFWFAWASFQPETAVIG